MKEGTPTATIDLPTTPEPILGQTLGTIDKILKTANSDSRNGKASGRKFKIERASFATSENRLVGLRQYLAEQEGEGYWDFLELRPGFYIIITDARYRRDTMLDLPGEPMLKVRVVLSGEIRFPDLQQNVRTGDACVQSIGSDEPASYTIPKSDTPLQMVAVLPP
ncbi:MAG: hypothetical protein HRT80_16555 [Henriciella sp.]|nr:hypothetical protein [Henriciella sp.]